MHTLCTLINHSCTLDVHFSRAVHKRCAPIAAPGYYAHHLLTSLHQNAHNAAPLKLVVLLLGVWMVGGPYHSPRVDIEELASCSRPTLFVALASFKGRRVRSQGGGNRPMLADRNQRQAAQDRLSWHNVDDRVRACVVNLFRACKCHASPPRRHPAANHVKRVGGVHSMHIQC